MRKDRPWARRVRVITGLVALVLLFAGWTAATEPRVGPHSALDLALMRNQIEGLDVVFGPYFVTAGRCAGCHGHDSLGIAMMDESGNDVNVVNDWRSTMMGNSARDPFFRAKIEHESLVDTAHAEQLQTKCLGCHAPLGMHQEEMLHNPPFTLAMLDTSYFGRDGVSCLACHMQSPTAAGHVFSGQLQFDSARVYGPYADSTINAAIMQFFVRFTPGYGEHIQDGRVCAGCHGLVTDTHDLSGEPTGGHFFEQATWQEWKNSVYPGEENCRSCHMPRTDDPVILASEYIFLPAHSPFGKHHLAGGNTFMLRLMRDHKDELGIPATTDQFDSTIARSLRQLHKAVDLDVALASRSADTMGVDVHLTNRTGHKFPSGYPSRRAFLRLVVTNDAGDTLFRNGLIDATNEVIGHDAGYEPHRDVITAEDQVQIYEMVMGDVNGNVTTVLERAAAPIKDDRIPPVGFVSTHPSYDTAMIAGVDAADLDFNRDVLGLEGSGGDIVHYRIPMNGFTGNVHVTASLHYQPVPPAWNAEMFTTHSTGIDRFRTLYHDAEGTPEQVAVDSLSDDRTGVSEPEAGPPVRAFPNPTSDGTVTLLGEGIRLVTLYDASGKRISVLPVPRASTFRLTLPTAAGTYQLAVTTTSGTRMLRVVRLGER